MKTMRSLFLALCALSLLLLPAAPALAQQPAASDVPTRALTIWSEGTRMAGTVFTPPSAGPNDRLPTLLMAHGWGGVAAQLARDARAFANAGYLVVTFDYRGWGNSDSRVILADQPPPADQRQNGRFTAGVIEVREVVDPVDMLADWQNALHWLHGESQVDTTRIGVWGSSQSGGYVVEMAIRDPRIKAVHSQVGALSGHGMGTTPQAYQEATRRARGEIGYPEPGATVVGNLRGAPIAPRFANYAPVDRINEAGNIPIQFVLAEDEELFDNREHGIRAHDLYRGPKRLVIIPDITHYGIYREAWQQANQLALDWFDQHLKP
jgi:uncharacterized protein